MSFHYCPRFIYDLVTQWQNVHYLARPSFKIFKISSSEFDTLRMHRGMRACTDEFLATVTEGLVDSVYKVVTWSSFGVMECHKASGGKWTFPHCVTRLYTNLGL